MMATHELVVPKSIPMTSPASFAAVDFHRSGCNDVGDVVVAVADNNDPLFVNSDRRKNDDDPNPLRILSCNAILYDSCWIVLN
jgi:hypothetical protein